MNEPAVSDKRAALGHALMEMHHWIVDVELKDGNATAAGFRAIAATWVLDPGIFGRLSLSELAQKIGAPNTTLLRSYIAEFSSLLSSLEEEEPVAASRANDGSGSEIPSMRKRHHRRAH